MKKSIRLLSVLMAAALFLSACGKQPGTTKDSSQGQNSQEQSNQEQNSQEKSSQEKSSQATNSNDNNQNTSQVTSEYFTERDFKVNYDEAKSAFIKLNGDTAECSSNAVKIKGSTITITDEGTYILSGTLNDGMIIVDSEKTDKTQLVLNGVSIHSETSAPIYILQSDKVFITLADGTENTLSNGGTFTAFDENNIDAVIFSKEDITLNGSGMLVITSPAGHGIVSKDSLKITGGTYDITSSSHALAGKDDVCIADAVFTLTAGKDGVHAENADDTASGFVYIQSGTFDISAEGDGVSAAATMEIIDGSFHIVTGGGSENAAAQTSDSWGGFMGGMGGGRGGMGGNPGGMGGNPGGMGGKGSMGGNGFMGGSSGISSSDTDTSEDSTSIKGLKAGGNMTISGGTFQIDSADDAVHSNTSIDINGGIFEIASGDDGFHADETLTIDAGTIAISESYEGLEGLHVNVTGGEIVLTADDDGINAAGGTDQSGFGGPRGNDRFGGSGNSSGSIVISGGVLNITAYGDGIDANGTLEITDGDITVCGPIQGDTATLDYDLSAVIKGGTFLGTGGSAMAQSFSDSEQGVIGVNAGNRQAGTSVKIKDSKGNTILTCEPALPFAIFIYSSPEIIKGETYTLEIGTDSGEITAG